MCDYVMFVNIVCSIFRESILTLRKYYNSNNDNNNIYFYINVYYIIILLTFLSLR
jgi:hypothetical protein